MRRSALVLLTLHFAALPLSAQTTTTVQVYDQNGLEVRQGGRQVTFPATQPALETARPATFPALEPARPATFPAAPPALEAARPAAPVKENLLSFDPQHAEVNWAQNHWQLVADGNLLKDFGRREVEARVALRLVRDMRLTQRGVVGSPEPVMEYWLCDGRAPHGMTAGLHVTPIDPAQLRVEQTQGQWVIRDPGRVLFNFGGHETDARDALSVIMKYGFTQIGVLGSAGPSMVVMLGHPEAASEGDPNMPHLVHQSPLREGPKDPKAPPPPPPVGDKSPVVTPVIPPLHPPAGTRKEPSNSFGNVERVEGPPAGEPLLPKHAPAPPPLAAEWIDRTPFDWRQVQLRQDGTQHTLSAGTLVLARFNNDRDARLALAAVQHYRFTELDRVGRPQPYCSYLLCAGQAPHGQYIGLHADAFQADRLSVSKVEGRWAIVSGDQPILWFGDRPEEARVTLDVIQRNQFDRLCKIGDERGLTFFVRSR
jgi:hypothetical protein